MSFDIFKEALKAARERFQARPDDRSAADFLEAAHEAWNESAIDECAYDDNVLLVTAWLRTRVKVSA